jgi:hypothetical protein
MVVLGTGLGAVSAYAQLPLVDFSNPAVDGSNPNSLIQAQDGYFYGTTATGGNTLGKKICLDYNGNDVGCGTIFRMDSAGNETVIKHFQGTDGAWPNGLILFHDGALYGTTAFGGASLNQPADTGSGTETPSCVNPSVAVGTNWLNIGCGTIFRITTAGVFRSLYSFPGAVDSSHPNGGAVGGTEKGSFPNTLIVGALVLNGEPTEVMFGTTLACNGLTGTPGYYSGYYEYACTGHDTGILFQYSPPASISAVVTELTILHTFLSTDSSAYPNSLVQGSDGSLYGTTTVGTETVESVAPCLIGLGGYGCGNVFQYSFPPPPDVESSATVACSFWCASNSSLSCTNGVVSQEIRAFHPAPGIVVRQPYRNYPGSQWQLNSYPMSLTEGSDGNFYGVTSSWETGGAQSQAFQCLPHTASVAETFPTPTGTFNILYTFDGAGQGDGGGSTTGLTLGGDGNYYGVSIQNVFDVPASVAASYISAPGTAPLSTLPEYAGFSLSAYPNYSLNSLTQGGDSNFYATASSSSATDGGAIFKFAGPEYPIYLYPMPGEIQVGTPFSLEWEVSNAHSLTALQCNVFAQNSPVTAGSWAIPVANAGDHRFNPYSNVEIIPTAVGTYTYAMNCGGTETGYTTVEVIPGPLFIEDATLPDGTVGSVYTASLTGTGGTPPYTFSVTGSLPPGLLMATSDQTLGPNYLSAVIAGTPSQQGTFSFSVTVTDSQGNTASATDSITIEPASTGLASSSLTLTAADGTSANALIQAQDGNFYGTSATGGSSTGKKICFDSNGNDVGCGTLFRVNTDSTISVVANFPGGTGGYSPTGLIQGSDGNFYGTTAFGGITLNGSTIYCADASGNNIGCGTIFRVPPPASESSAAVMPTVIYSFPGAPPGVPNGVEGGSFPNPIILGANGVMYGTTLACNYPLGNPGDMSTCDFHDFGTIFQFTPPAAGSTAQVTPTVLYTFDGSNDMIYPNSLLMGSDGKLYGTVQIDNFDGCTIGTQCGALFQFTLPASPGGQGTMNVLYNFSTASSTYGEEIARVKDTGTIGSSQARLHSNVVVRQPSRNYPTAGEPWTLDNIPTQLTEASDGSIYGTMPTQTEFLNTYNVGQAFQYVPPSSANSAVTLNTISVGDWSNGLTLASDGNFYGLDDTGIYQIPPVNGQAAVPPLFSNLSPGTPTSLMQGSDGNFHGTMSVGSGSAVFTVPYALAPPISLSVSPANPITGSSFTLSWTVFNAFSLSAQQCYAFLPKNTAGAGTWAGLQSGVVANGDFSGSATITPTKPGTYIYALTCGGTESGFATVTVTNGITATPVLSLAYGTYQSAQTLTITDTTPGAVIYYSVNGAAPTTSSNKYMAPLVVNTGVTIQAVALAPGYTLSNTSSAMYTFVAASPLISPGACSHSAPFSVTITSATPTAKIFYTTNGATPSASSMLYTGPITVGASETIKAIAAETGYTPSAVAMATYTIVSSVATAAPKLSLNAGTYNSAQTVTITDATAGAVIYYTLNGAAPTTSSIKYTGPLSINAGVTLQAVAVAPGYALSGINSAVYVFAASPPMFTPPAGGFSATQSVALSSATPTAKIFYTTNGATPSASTTLYTGPITVSKSETVKAIAAETGYTPSAVVSAAYTIAPATATPVPSLPSGNYSSSQSLTFTDATAGAVIYYTLNGTTPTAASTKYTGPIPINSSVTVEAVAMAPGYLLSAALSSTYSFTASVPVISPAAGQYGGPVTVTFTSTTPSASIYYTINGATPTTSSTLYAGPFTVSTSETVKAFASYTGYSPSAVASTAYTIVPGVATATPTFSLSAGTYHSAQTVAITDTTPGAVIYYTVNGAAPTTSSNKYTAPITINAAVTVQAVALAPGYTLSNPSSAAYTFAALPPVFTPVGGDYSVPQTVTITSATPTAKIFYTTNGATPSASTTLYTGPITVSASETIKAIAAETGYTPSAVVSASYTIAPATTVR